MQLSLVLLISVFIYNVWLMTPLHKIYIILQNPLNGQHGSFDEFTKKDNEIGKLGCVLKRLCEASEDSTKAKSKKKTEKKE